VRLVGFEAGGPPGHGLGVELLVVGNSVGVVQDDTMQVEGLVELPTRLSLLGDHGSRLPSLMPLRTNGGQRAIDLRELALPGVNEHLGPDQQGFPPEFDFGIVRRTVEV